MGDMFKKPNGFGVVKTLGDPMRGQPSGHAPRRVGQMQGPDPHPQIDRDARRRARRAQRASRRVARLRAS